MPRSSSNDGRVQELQASTGGPGRIRTCGFYLRRVALYPLSYGSCFWFVVYGWSWVRRRESCTAECGLYSPRCILSGQSALRTETEMEAEMEESRKEEASILSARLFAPTYARGRP